MAKASTAGDMELIAFTDVAGFAGIENGQAVVKPLEVSVNKDVTGLATKFSERMHGERIEVYKRTLPAKHTGQMSAVEKNWKEVQTPFEKRQSQAGLPDKTYEPESDYEPKQGEPSGLSTLKNMVDQLDNRESANHRSSTNLATIGIIAGAAALGLGISALMWLSSLPG